MSIQWTFVAGYLYFEIAVVVIMMLPIASPRRWHQFFKSRLFSVFQTRTALYFYIFQGVLGLFLVDAIREMRKYSHTNDLSNVHLTAEMKGNVKLFRAQRNFYITGFAIFLTFVIRRLVTMIMIQAELLQKSERIVKEAEAAKNLAKNTVLKHTMESSEVTHNYDEIKKQMETLENLLKEEKTRCLWLEQEAARWRLKYEESAADSSVAAGKGDE